MTARTYLDGLPFRPDPFQIEAAEAIDRGASVVVTAPTGAGKTVVAEAAMVRAHARGLRALYTTPLKALSNQKFGDFRTMYGDRAVGLLTGDNAINGSAATVVMTTEVLRNMMYAGSPDLDDVGVVILDEVHYLQDRDRGGVWEEIIVHLDRRIPLVCLSATIANADEFVDWMRERRGDLALVVERERPVPLESLYLARDRWERGGLKLFPVFHGSRPNDRVARMLRAAGKGSRRYATPRRHETCVYLRDRGLLPAIYFIFSRKGCDDACDMVVARGLQLTSSSEAAEIRAVAAINTSHLSPDDLAVIGYERWLRNLAAGVAPHHAGLVPAMKETVEELFSAGLVRLVFATETLALGINMPARTVVLESLSKFTGETHELLQPGDYTQLTGRAGRRGIDEEGTAVILHSPYVEFERAAGIAGRGSHPLRSSFRPTYNMAVNLVAHYERDRAEALLAASFAEFADRRTQDAQDADLAADASRLEELRAAATHPGVDIWQMVTAAVPSEDPLVAFAARTSPGDVLEWQERGHPRRFVVVARGTGTRPRLLTISQDADIRRLAPDRLPDSVSMIGRIDLPKPYRPRDLGYRTRVAGLITRLDPTSTPQPLIGDEPRADPTLKPHLDAARAALRLERSLESRRTRLATRTPGVVGAFHRHLRLLEQWGYARDWDLTEKGNQLRTLYNDIDLLLAETINRGWFSGLDGPSTAGLASAFTYEARREASGEIWPPSIAQVGGRVMALWAELTAAERAHRLPETRRPDPGFAAVAMAWASGASLLDMFGDEETTAVGDFVRNCRQLIDLLHQIHEHDPDASGIRAARRAIDRGVVAAAGAL